MDFALFLLVNAALFLRPAEIVPELQRVPVYEYLIITCLAFSSLAIGRRLWDGTFWRQPTTVFVFGMLPAVVLSGGREFDLSRSLKAGEDLAKILIYYLLLVSVVNTPKRIRVFLVCLTVLAAAMTMLAVLDFTQIVDVPGVKQIVDREEGEEALSVRTFTRLSGSGIFNDPNDICTLFVITIPLCLWLILDDGQGVVRFFWLAPLTIFFYALHLTKSRGGLYAVGLGVFALLWSRFGPRLALALMVVLAPAALVFFAGRQTDLSSTETATQRLELWQDAVTSVKYYPALGIGYGEFARRYGYVTHNSFLHCYAELGMFGGTIFLGAFFCALWGMCRLKSGDSVIVDPTLRSLHPYVLAVLIGFIGLLMTLSRSYMVPTYLALGMVTSYAHMAETQPAVAPLRIGRRLVGWLCAASVAFVGIAYVALRILVRYS